MIPFDGMREHLKNDFSAIYHIDLKGNARTSEERRRKEGGNIFRDQIRVGVGITVLVRNRTRKRPAEIRLFSIDDYLRAEAKEQFLDKAESVLAAPLGNITTVGGTSWFSDRLPVEYQEFTALLDPSGIHGIFDCYSNGIQSNRDAWVFNYEKRAVATNMSKLIETYDTELSRWNRAKGKGSVDDFVLNDQTKIKWCSKLKQLFEANIRIEFDEHLTIGAQYRPFSKQWLYFDPRLIHRPGQIESFFPPLHGSENISLVVTSHSQIPFSAQALNGPICLDVGGRPSQMFPFYTYAEDGTHRRENVTDWALYQFRSHYTDPSITKWDIFHYVYAILHHPDYRQRYAANLRRELPRIPFVGTGAKAPDNATPDAGLKPGSSTELTSGTAREAAVVSATAVEERPFKGRVTKAKKENSTALPKAVAGGQSPQATGATTNAEVFRAFVKAGQRLAEIHVSYEKQPEYPLTKIEKKGEKLDYRVEKMKLSKDKTQLIYNQFLTLAGFPPETCEYRLGNRSALEWIIDQYQVSTDKRSGITNDPNRDDPQYILRLLGQVITVSLETMELIKGLPQLHIHQQTSIQAGNGA